MHCYACDDDPDFNYGDVLLESVRSVLTAFGVLQNGKLVGLESAQHEKSLLEMNLFANTEFDFSMVFATRLSSNRTIPTAIRTLFAPVPPRVASTISETAAI